MNQDKLLLSTGEFAKLCNTTKDTLFHYERIGILRPIKVSPNGYRYYHVNQYCEFDIIWILRDAGSSLAEIKEYLKDSNPLSYVELLERKVKELELKQAKLKRDEMILRQSIELTKRAVDVVVDSPKIVEHDEEYLIAMRLPKCNDEKSYIETMNFLFHYCDESGYYESPSTGSIVSAANLSRGDFSDSHCFVKLGTRVDSDPYLIVKPKGMYATLYHRGFYDTVDSSIEVLCDFIEADGYEVIGDLYCYDVLSYFTVSDPNQMVVELSVMVRARSSR